MTKKKSIYLWGLLLLFLGTINSCRNDFLQEQQNQNETNNIQLKSRIISLSQSKHKARLLSELSESKKILAKKIPNNASGKTVNFGDTISIDTEHVILIENGPNYHTYTFNIKRLNPQPNDPVENLVLTPLPDGT